VDHPVTLPITECIELNSLDANQECPVGVTTVRSLQFKLTAHTTRTGLRWRRAADSSDVLTPSDGDVSSDGKTTVLLSDIVLDSSVRIEVVSGGTVLLAFTLRHY
jgi:hypothetical protein